MFLLRKNELPTRLPNNLLNSILTSDNRLNSNPTSDNRLNSNPTNDNRNYTKNYCVPESRSNELPKNVLLNLLTNSSVWQYL